MSETCNHDCASCAQNCGDKTEIQKIKPHEHSKIKHVIGILSGKGGVGKSLVSGLLASEMAKKGFKCAVLDADITGPSIPKIFGVHQRVQATPDGSAILPATAKNGVKIMSLNLLLEDETDPVIWRGTLINSAVTQFWKDVIWGDIDYMFIDMPPGTGDVTMTVFQMLPIDGIIIVTSPQELVGMIVDKSVKMAGKMNISVLGLVENMSYLKCPDCGKEMEIFGKSRVYETAGKFNISPAVRLPLCQQTAKLCDEGSISQIEEPALEPLLSKLATL